MFFLIRVLSDECIKVVDIALFGLEEVLDLFEFEDGLFDLTNVHVGKETDYIIFLIFVVGVKGDDEYVGQEQEKHVQGKKDQDKLEIPFFY